MQQQEAASEWDSQGASWKVRAYSQIRVCLPGQQRLQRWRTLHNAELQLCDGFLQRWQQADTTGGINFLIQPIQGLKKKKSGGYIFFIYLKVLQVLGGKEKKSGENFFLSYEFYKYY